MKRNKILSLLLALTLSLACRPAAAVNRDSSASDQPRDNFHVALSSDIFHWTRLLPRFYDQSVVNQITEGLLTFDSNNKLVPLLAKD